MLLKIAYDSVNRERLWNVDCGASWGCQKRLSEWFENMLWGEMQSWSLPGREVWREGVRRVQCVDKFEARKCLITSPV